METRDVVGLIYLAEVLLFYIGALLIARGRRVPSLDQYHKVLFTEAYTFVLPCFGRMVTSRMVPLWREVRWLSAAFQECSPNLPFFSSNSRTFVLLTRSSRIIWQFLTTQGNCRCCEYELRTTDLQSSFQENRRRRKLATPQVCLS